MRAGVHLKTAGLVIAATFATMSAAVCGHAAPLAPAAPDRLDPTGTWTGRGEDTQGAATFTLRMQLAGNIVWGSVATQGNTADGTCASCHKTTSGTFSGTLTGTALHLDLFFPNGNDGVPTPMCSVRMTVTAANVTAQAMNATYVGDDSCEGSFTNGTVSLTRSP
jgi:hypothetical protein